ncbi:MAG: peptidyl-prolyl cis-trans isomerase [Candidatus Omnitrophica bacterium]|nr:peptidyl-prolyl cis-trans isomerase [Candidatus Omnitrophota bacterium]
MRIFKPFLLFLFLAVFMLPLKAHAMDDAILAIVNDEVITIKDLQAYMKGVYAQLKIEGKSQDEANDIMKQYESKGINQLIDDRLILAAAEKAGIMIKPKPIDERLADIKKKYASEEEFTKAILKEGMTISEIRKKIENQYKGQVVIDDEVRKKVSVNPQEVTDYFNAHASEYRTKPRVFLESIFVKTSFGRSEAKAKIEKAASEIKAGADFKQVSAKYSDLPSVGEINQEDIRPEMKDAVLALRAGEVSGIIEVDNGYYIFKMGGLTSGSDVSLKDMKDQIYQQIFDEKFHKRFEEWLADLRKKAYVEIKE